MNRFGPKCEFPPPCTVINTPPGKPGFPQYGTEWKLLKDAAGAAKLVYGRPVYVHIFGGGIAMDMFVYTGRRWILTSNMVFTNPKLDVAGAAARGTSTSCCRSRRHRGHGRRRRWHGGLC